VSAYDEAARKLINLFVENFEQHIPNVDNDVKRALDI
jgi:ATP-dependent phosphoenolpyruvate carboxykinase